MKEITEYTTEHLCSNRRLALKSALGLTIAGMTACADFGAPSIFYADNLTKEERDKLTSDQIIAELKAGNLRFRTRTMAPHDYVEQKIASAGAQFPSAAILSCIDSRAPAEIIFDMGIGQSFNARVAGNIANKDLIGSLEFACAAAGAKVIVVMGHTSCGAIKGAIDNVVLGNLTGLLDKIKPAISATSYSGERNSKNDEFVDAVAKMNVLQTINDIRTQSDVLRSLEKSGALKIVGAMYHLNDGKVEFELPAR